MSAESPSSAETPAAGGSSLLRTVGPDDVFNLPLYEHHLVLDIRPPDEYSRGHMATAVSFPYLPLQSVCLLLTCSMVYKHTRAPMTPKNILRSW